MHSKCTSKMRQGVLMANEWDMQAYCTWFGAHLKDSGWACLAKRKEKKKMMEKQRRRGKKKEKRVQFSVINSNTS